MTTGTVWDHAIRYATKHVYRVGSAEYFIQANRVHTPVTIRSRKKRLNSYRI